MHEEAFDLLNLEDRVWRVFWVNCLDAQLALKHGCLSAIVSTVAGWKSTTMRQFSCLRPVQA